jgi:hypothetical protein
MAGDGGRDGQNHDVEDCGLDDAAQETNAQADTIRLQLTVRELLL